jgi:hypothetical protein
MLERERNRCRSRACRSRRATPILVGQNGISEDRGRWVSVAVDCGRATMSSHDPPVRPEAASNRRRLPRVRWDGSAKIFIGKHILECQVVDLSETGMRIRGSWSGYRGQSVKVSMELDGQMVHVFGEVVWSSGEATDGWGIRFTAIHPSAARKLARFIDARPKLETPPPRQPSRRSRGVIVDLDTSISAEEPAPKTPTGMPPIRPIPCTPEIRARLEKILDAGFASGSILRGAKGAMTKREQLFVQIERGPIVVLPGDDPIAGRLRWLAASVATWAGGASEQSPHGPESPLVIRA